MKLTRLIGAMAAVAIFAGGMWEAQGGDRDVRVTVLPLETQVVEPAPASGAPPAKAEPASTSAAKKLAMDAAKAAAGAIKDEERYRSLYEECRAWILTAAKEGNKGKVAQQTSDFNERIGGRLLWASVSRVDAAGKVENLLNQGFGARRVSLPKIHYASSDKPHVTRRKDEGGDYVLIETNSMGGGKYADGIFITLALDGPTGAMAGRGKTVEQIVNRPGWEKQGAVIVARAEDEARRVVGGKMLLGHTLWRQALKVTTVLKGDVAKDAMIEVDYVLVNLVESEERPVGKGEQAIWMLEKTGATWLGVKVLADTPENRSAVGDGVSLGSDVVHYGCQVEERIAPGPKPIQGGEKKQTSPKPWEGGAGSGVEPSSQSTKERKMRETLARTDNRTRVQILKSLIREGAGDRVDLKRLEEISAEHVREDEVKWLCSLVPPEKGKELAGYRLDILRLLAVLGRISDSDASTSKVIREHVGEVFDAYYQQLAGKGEQRSVSDLRSQASLWSSLISLIANFGYPELFTAGFWRALEAQEFRDYGVLTRLANKDILVKLEAYKTTSFCWPFADSGARNTLILQGIGVILILH